MAAFLDLVATGRVDPHALVTRRIAMEDAPGAYEELTSAQDSPLGVVLQYGATGLAQTRSHNGRAAAGARAEVVNVVGAGSFAQRILIPGLKEAGLALRAVASEKGLSARSAADRFGFERAVTPEEATQDPGADLVAIATRHTSHAHIAAEALSAGKAVFVEKPPCLSWSELDLLLAARADSGRPLFVGFNRRHAPFARRLRESVLGEGGPMELFYRVNAGQLPRNHWLSDPDDGGGRLLGEGCHFIDFACWLIDTLPVSVAAVPGAPSCSGPSESFGVTLGFGDGSVATILYSSRGASNLSKEYVEVHTNGRSMCIDDYRLFTTYDGRRRRTERLGRQDKGHRDQFNALASGSDAGQELDPLSSFAVTLEAQDVISGRGTGATVERRVGAVNGV